MGVQMMTVYIELFLADNFLMNFLVLYLASKMVCQKNGMGKLSLSAAAGCLYAVCVFVFSLDFLNTLFFKIAVSLFLCFTAFGFKSIKLFFTEFLAMYIVTLFLGGGAFFAIYLLGGSVDMNGVILIHSDEFRYMLLGILITAALIGRIKNALRKVNVRDGLIHKIRIVSGERSAELSAFLDTGNSMTGLFGEPVILAEQSRISGLMEDAKNSPVMRRLPYRTVSGIGEVDAFKADEVIFLSGEKRSVSNVLIAVYGGRLCADGSYGALLNPTILF
jgi:stage II sporulation protein GA (sporulation sigma-E factor processing peptidase)